MTGTQGLFPCFSHLLFWALAPPCPLSVPGNDSGPSGASSILFPSGASCATHATTELSHAWGHRGHPLRVACFPYLAFKPHPLPKPLKHCSSKFRHEATVRGPKHASNSSHLQEFCVNPSLPRGSRLQILVLDPGGHTGGWPE